MYNPEHPTYGAEKPGLHPLDLSVLIERGHADRAREAHALEAEQEREAKTLEFAQALGGLTLEDISQNVSAIVIDSKRDQALTAHQSYPNAGPWAELALNGKSPEPHDLKSGKDWREASRAREKVKHLGTLTARLALKEDGIYQIGRDGKSTLPKEDLSRRMRKSIRREERAYGKLARKQQYKRSYLENSDRNFIVRHSIKDKAERAVSPVRKAGSITVSTIKKARNSRRNNP